MIIELRSTGHQTVVPPSTHPSGDILVWDNDGDPAEVTGDTLRQFVADLAASALLARHWPRQGSRQDAALAVSGLLLSHRISEARTKAIVGGAARAATDPEWHKREDAVAATAAAISAGEPVTGGPTLEGLLSGDGLKVVGLLRKWLQLKGARATHEDPSRPLIDAGELDLPTITPRAVAALQAANEPPRLFMFGERLTRTVNTPDQGLRLQPVGANELWSELGHVAQWFKTTKTNRRIVSPPNHVVRDMCARTTLPFPVLRGVTRTPTFAPEGRLIATPGFDISSGLFYHPPNGLTIPAVSTAARTNSVGAAVDLLLNDVLVDFPFASDADRANALALLLLPFGRELIAGPTPLHLIEKPQPGTGATLLVDIVGEIIGAEGVTQLTEAGEQEEWRKRLTSALLDAPQVLVIDNVRTALDSAALASAITTGIWKDRLLGESRIVRTPVSCVWIATGNNPRLSNEMARRAVRIRLDAHTDQPWLRTVFKHPKLRTHVRARRGEIIGALLTIIQAWLHAGSPQGRKTLGKFENWADVVGGILDNAGVSGFLEGQASIYESADVETSAWRTFVERWWDTHNVAPVGVRDLWPLVEDPDPIDLDLGYGDERGLKTKLGRRIQQARDRWFGDIRIVAHDKAQHAQRWRLERVISGSTNGALPTTAAIRPQVSIDQLFASLTQPTDTAREPSEHGEPLPAPVTGLTLSDNGGTPAEGAARPVSVFEAMTAQPVPQTPIDAARVGEPTLPAPGASLPLFITHDMRRRLRGIGFTEAEVDAMTPDDAWRRLDVSQVK